MAETITLYECLDLKSSKKEDDWSKFTILDNEAYRRRDTQFKTIYTPLLLEIQSKCPPTNCTLIFKFTLQANHPLYEKENQFEINFIEHIGAFRYENNFYSLALQDNGIIKISDGAFTILARFNNERDENSTAKLFFKTRIPESQY